MSSVNVLHISWSSTLLISCPGGKLFTANLSGSQKKKHHSAYTWSHLLIFIALIWAIFSLVYTKKAGNIKYGMLWEHLAMIFRIEISSTGSIIVFLNLIILDVQHNIHSVPYDPKPNTSKLSDAEPKIFWESWVNTMTVDTRAPFVTMVSTDSRSFD